MSSAAAEQQKQQPDPRKPPQQSGGGYDVARPLGKCAVTGETIAPGDKFMAALRETPLGFERVDVSMPAWPQFERSDVVAFWQATMPAQEQKKKLFVDDEVLCDLFERLKDAAEPAKLNFRFVLGLILMRKKLLLYEASRSDEGQDIWEMRFKGREERLDLLNPKLDESQMAEVSQQLGQILNEEM